MLLCVATVFAAEESSAEALGSEGSLGEAFEAEDLLG